MTTYNGNRASSSAEDGRFLEWGPYTADLKSHCLYLNEQRVEIPPCTFGYMVSLLRHAPEAVSYQELIWEALGTPLPRLESQDVARTRVYMLRRALGDQLQTSRFIAAVSGYGYRLNA
jgi:DNA-binding response OmpR family regulator